MVRAEQPITAEQTDLADTEPEPGRVRQRGKVVMCRICGGDCFVYSSKLIPHAGYPACLHRRPLRRVRYYKCSECGTTMRRLIRE